MVAPHAIIVIEFLQMAKIANYVNTNCNNYNNNVILYYSALGCLTGEQ